MSSFFLVVIFSFRESEKVDRRKRGQGLESVHCFFLFITQQNVTVPESIDLSTWIKESETFMTDIPQMLHKLFV